MTKFPLTSDQDLIPMPIAKAMKLVVGTKDNESRPSLQQVLCEASKGVLEGEEITTARFVGTNGHVMLIVDTKLDAPEHGAYQISAAPEPKGKLATSDLAQFIDSKGHRQPEFFRVRDRVLPEFPDYKQVMWSDTSAREGIKQIGFDVKYMDMMLKIHKALQIGNERRVWSVKFKEALGPTIWEPEMHGHDLVRAVQFVVMPCRLD